MNLGKHAVLAVIAVGLSFGPARSATTGATVEPWMWAEFNTRLVKLMLNPGLDAKSILPSAAMSEVYLNQARTDLQKRGKATRLYSSGESICAVSKARTVCWSPVVEKGKVGLKLSGFKKTFFPKLNGGVEGLGRELGEFLDRSVLKNEFAYLALFLPSANAGDTEPLKVTYESVLAPVYVSAKGWQWLALTANTSEQKKAFVAGLEPKYLVDGKVQCEKLPDAEDQHGKKHEAFGGVVKSEFAGRAMTLKKFYNKYGPLNAHSHVEFADKKSPSLLLRQEDWYVPRINGLQDKICQRVKGTGDILRDSSGKPLILDEKECATASRESTKDFGSDLTSPAQGPNSRIMMPDRGGTVGLGQKVEVPQRFLGFTLGTLTRWVYECKDQGLMVCDLSENETGDYFPIKAYAGDCDIGRDDYGGFHCAAEPRNGPKEMYSPRLDQQMINALTLIRDENQIKELRTKSDQHLDALNKFTHAQMALYEAEVRKQKDKIPALTERVNTTKQAQKSLRDDLASALKLTDAESEKVSSLSRDLFHLNGITLCCNDSKCRKDVGRVVESSDANGKKPGKNVQ